MAVIQCLLLNQDISQDVCQPCEDHSMNANSLPFSHPLCFSLRSESTSTPYGMASLTVWTWLPSASSLLTPSLTPGFLSSFPPACCTFFGGQSAIPLWPSLKVLCLNCLWPNLQPTSNCVSQRWSPRSLSPMLKHYDHLQYLMMWHLYLFDWRVR